MEPERWQQIAALCGRALELSAADRTEFLRDRCGDDQALRAEVESLLSVAVEPGLLDSAIESEEFKPSAVLGGRFKIVQLIGRGGMGEVYQAEDLQLGGYVALKNIRPELLHNSQAVERFKREIQLAKKVTHPNVCRIYDVGFHPSSSDPNAKIFLTMELLEGQTLSSRLAAGPMRTAEALPIIQQMADALGAAHQAGIVHRDFKSGNVMLMSGATGSRAVVMDFGLAGTTDQSERAPSEAVTLTRGAVGTPEYMAPEQLTGGSITPAADIYAFGIVIYEMVTGSRPFQGHTPFEAAARRLHEAPQSPRQLNPELEPHWNHAILRCLSRRPEDRFQDTAEVMSALSGKRAIRGAPRWWSRVLAIGAACVVAAIAAALMHIPPQKRPSEGAQWQQLTNFNDAATGPALSPDGRVLAFKLGGTWFTNPGQIYIKLLPDGQPVQLTHDPLGKGVPVFSPDGSRLVYSVTEPNTDVFELWEASVPPHGAEPRLIMNNAEGLTWIDKQHILFSEEREPLPLMAVVTSTEGLTASRDVYVPKNPNWMAHFSSISPDHKQVLIVEMEPGPATNYSPWFPCRLAPFDGSSKGKQVGPVPSHCIAAAWSPDGRWMYFSARVDDRFHLWRQRPEGGEPQQITSGPTQEQGLAIAPDGRSVITSVGVDQTTVWIHDANGEHQISGEGDARSPVFSPDGQRVYYLSTHDLWIIEPASGHTERVLPGVSVTEYALSPNGKAIAYTTMEGSLWYGSVDRQAPPHLLSRQGHRPEFSLSGDIFFRAGSILFRIHPDATGRLEVPGNPGDLTHSNASISPDEEWTTRVSDDQHLLAYPKTGGRPVTLCYECYVVWTVDGKFLRLTLHPLAQNGLTAMIPLKGKSMLPALPPEGFQTRAELMKIPGVQIVSAEVAYPASDGASYAFVKQDSRWNLYRIRLP